MPDILKCYLGTFLGAPSEIEINNLTDPIKISLIKGFIKDKIAIDWTINLTHQSKYTSITCEGEKFYLPDRIKVPLPQKLLGRHLFSKKDANMVTSLVMVYGNEIMVKGLNVNKASSTFNFDVETGLATMSDTLNSLLCTSHQLLVMQQLAVTLAATGPAHGTGTESHSLIIP